MDKSLKYTIIVGIIIISLSAAYYLVIFLPHSANNKNDVNKKAGNETLKSGINKQPSERALSAATDLYFKYISKSEDGKKTFFEKYSSGNDDFQLAIRNYALFLDGDTEKLVIIEELLSNSNGNNVPNIAPVAPIQVPQTFQVDGESAMDKYERESKEQCQKDLATYTACMIEYNAKMTEYNACISNSYGGYCYKPSNFCFKPLCAY